ncbi:regulatory protein, LysR:LysR, substrate-binding [Stappia aggregata IAM 12614]|uniref:Regulatory protein, LysR:LysR, substrate-binding n=1 Tax=Roseibium aggregatum (strain ATCC 25650 / DSM 13394 / JCM 20685 / NBRC 16684 / NCIMB 2208 / IAM 12614 / B1) TaxID=384765 RepID=A0NZW9_ROSAI|nr:LysR substrate-binding domain-containing protein [Roseibium aggregatum]EAV41686.1 regulatory protein, LysR:LysR, substrate-binding [Stappia aggregata IAM 12614] [Roseibium aggregatum IAM 12614]
MRMIVSLAELGLVARVAEALNVTQPAISKQIAELERIIGDSIVIRDRNRLYLTPIGRRLAEHARAILSQLDRAAFDIEAMARGVSGSVTVGAVGSVAPLLLPEAIALMKSSAPKANVGVVEGHFVSLLPELTAGKIDLLIARIWQPRELAGIRQATLFKEPIVVVVGRDHPLARQSDITWETVSQWPWILPQPNSVARQAVDALFARNGLLPPENTIASASLTLNLELMRKLPAVGLFPESLARIHSARGDIAVLPLDTENFLSEACCFWARDKQTADSTFDLFMQCLMQSASRM